MTAQELQDDFDAFFEDWYRELAGYGPMEEMHVCDNVGEHLVGNVYARYRNEPDASKAVEHLNNRYFDQMPLYAELCPVTDFREGSFVSPI
jgi:splicing factor U2AF subunit